MERQVSISFDVLHAQTLQPHAPTGSPTASHRSEGEPCVSVPFGAGAALPHVQVFPAPPDPPGGERRGAGAHSGARTALPGLPALLDGKERLQ